MAVKKAKKAAPKKAVKKVAPKKAAPKKAAKKATKAAPKKAAPKKAAKKAVKKKASKEGAAPVRYNETKKKQILAFVKKVNQSQGKGGMAEAARQFGMQPLTIARWIKKYGF